MLVAALITGCFTLAVGVPGVPGAAAPVDTGAAQEPNFPRAACFSACGKALGCKIDTETTSVCPPQTKGDVPIDTRIALISRAETLGVPMSSAATIPHAIKIDSLPAETGREVDGQVTLPALTPLSLQYFDPAGAYLIDNGHRLYVWLGARFVAAYCVVHFADNLRWFTGGKVPETFFTATLGCSAPRDAVTLAQRL